MSVLRCETHGRQAGDQPNDLLDRELPFMERDEVLVGGHQLGLA